VQQDKSTFLFYPAFTRNEDDGDSYSIDFVGDAGRQQVNDGLPLGEGVKRLLLTMQRLHESDDIDHPFHNTQIYVRQLVEEQRLSAPCLQCGQPVESHESYPVFACEFFAPVFYRFSCCVEFYVIVGFQPARLVGLFIPGEMAIISAFDYDNVLARMYYGPDTFLKHVHAFYALQSKYLRQVFDYRQTDSPKPLAISCAYVNNISHHVREEMPLVYKLVKSEGHLPDDATVIVGSKDTLDLGDLLGCEDSVVDSTRLPGGHLGAGEVLFDHIVSQKLFLTRAGCLEHIPAGLSEAVMSRARQLGREQITSEGRWLDSHSPLIWLTLRGNYRLWREQRQGLAQVVQQVRTRYPEAGFILDGSMGDRALGDEVLADLGAPEHVTNCMGMGMLASLALFERIDAYLMPFSNANFFPVVVPKPGVMHAAGGWIMKEEPFVVIPSNEEVEAVPVIGTVVETGDTEYDMNVCTANYTVPADDLASALLNLLDEVVDEAQDRVNR